ncbi:MarR family winged helix-turn-helix transcriptional regulator [Modestobacter sp. VKM Ac-2986]|uniref:MarR family winged helix-turn-helix transcriptional regulator n=1 Tax=Modestobacter sp. VKM Ac-2986 TaxID=3004140 RepID=UPI0022AA8419|nr:MarR family winged helix-turn-helix transcriptional regulator [Modestobacter sp. VKM Ac-2986]MCZ2827631.1 MarR family winged helix-turn-helix transcriptional regulator [Modestobacter sp. VKM Ac-2986]
MTEQPPAPPSDSPVMLTILAGRAWEARLNTALRAHGLTLRHLGALGHLAGTPGLSYTDLARRARVTVQSMHATVAALTALGAVAEPGGGRGRAALLEVTDRGRQLLSTGRDVVAALDAEFTAALPPPARAGLPLGLLAGLQAARDAPPAD